MVEKVEFAQLTSGGGQVTVDEKGDGSRIVVVKSGDRATVAAAWWRPEGSHYFYCRATLDGRAALAVDAFEKACRTLTPKHW